MVLVGVGEELWVLEVALERVEVVRVVLAGAVARGNMFSGIGTGD